MGDINHDHQVINPSVGRGLLLCVSAGLLPNIVQVVQVPVIKTKP